jgi:hypothetical protein
LEEVDDEDIDIPLNKNSSKKALLSLTEGAESFFKGGATVVPMWSILTLAWATTELFMAIGLDRLFLHLLSHLINSGGVVPEALSTIAFVAALSNRRSSLEKNRLSLWDERKHLSGTLKKTELGNI